uniref:DUF202 domain-containing protein n=1 Tax=Rhabditophanes sp. KR3021 TaxID=114890 RepID=A0AC35U4A2_9BILA
MERESRATLSRYDAQTLEPLPQNRLIPRIPVSNIFAQSTRNLKDINAGYIESVSSINPGVPPFRPDPLPKVSKYEMDGMILPYDEGGKHIPGGALGMARFFFLFKKYPALLCMIVGMLLLFGKGKNSLELTNSENIMIYFAFITGIIVMIGTLHGIHNHNYSSQRAKFQTLIKIPHLAIVIIAGTVQLVYAVISYTKLSDIKVRD